jgi:hypothetical protein
MPGWDADRYQRQFGFVSAMAGGVLELLDAGPGEVVLDLGCGTGELAAGIAATGARVIGLDRDPAMVAAAARRLGQANTLPADGHDLRLPQPASPGLPDPGPAGGAAAPGAGPGRPAGRAAAAARRRVVRRLPAAAVRGRRRPSGDRARVEYPPGRRRGRGELLR